MLAAVRHMRWMANLAKIRSWALTSAARAVRRLLDLSSSDHLPMDFGSPPRAHIQDSSTTLLPNCLYTVTSAYTRSSSNSATESLQRPLVVASISGVPALSCAWSHPRARYFISGPRALCLWQGVLCVSASCLEELQVLSFAGLVRSSSNYQHIHS